MKKQVIGLSVLTLLCASLTTSLARAEAPYLQPPQSLIYDTGGKDFGQSIGVDRNFAIAVTSDTGNGTVVIYDRSGTGMKYVVPFDEGNVHPTNEALGIPMTLVSRGLSAVAVYPKTHSIYAVGETFNGTDYDCLLKKYSQKGQEVWSRTFDGNGHTSHDFCNDIGLDPSGNVVIAGAKESMVSGYYNTLLAKFDANGNFVTDNGTGPENCGPSNCQTQINKISIDGNGRVVALAKYWMQNNWLTSWDAALKKIPGAWIDLAVMPEDLAADAKGNTYVVGYRDYYNNGNYEMHHMLVRYDTNLNETCGDQRLFDVYSYYHDVYDRWYGVTVAKNGHAYVSGSDQGNLIAMEYDAACAPQWTDATGDIAPLLYDGGGIEIGYDIGTDVYGNLFLTGAIGTYGVGWDALTLKYKHN